MSPSGNEHGLIVVVPVLDEEAVMGRLLERLTFLSRSTPVRGVVVVDDGSTDNTVGQVEKHAGASPFPVRLVRLSRNFGHQNAVLAGIDAALKWTEGRQAEWIGIIDGDLQDEPEDFRKLLDASTGQDVVYAVRQRRQDGFLMRVLSPLFYRLLARTARFHIPTDAGTFSIVRHSVARVILSASDTDPYFPGLRAWVGFRQKGVPLVRRLRAFGTSRLGLRGLMGLSLQALMLYSTLPFQVLLSAGLVVSTGSFILAIVLIAIRLLGLVHVPGATSILVAQSFTLGIQMIALGLVAHMIQRVQANTSRQHSAVIMEDRVLEESPNVRQAS